MKRAMNGHRTNQANSDVAVSSRMPVLKARAYEAQKQALAGHMEAAATAAAQYIAWMENLPERMLEGQEAYTLASNLQHTQKRCREVIAFLGSITFEDEAALQEVTSSLRTLSMEMNSCAMSMGNFTSSRYPVIGKSHLEQVRPASNAIMVLGLAANFTVRGALWFERIRSDAFVIEDPKAATRTRLQQFRQRERAGYQMAQIPLHKTDIALLRRHGFLQSVDEKDPKAVNDALHSFVQAAAAALDTEGQTQDIEAAVKAQPLEYHPHGFLPRWSRRLIQYAQAVLPGEPHH